MKNWKRIKEGLQKGDTEERNKRNGVKQKGRHGDITKNEDSFYPAAQ